MEPVKSVAAQQENEISLKDLILKIQEWSRYLLSKWLVLCIFGFVGGGLGLLYAIIKKPMYVAELTFVLEDGKSSNPLGAYAGLASQFGIDLGGSATSGIFAGDNILQFLRSRLMIEKTLLTPVKINGSTQTLADLYINMTGLREKWEKHPDLKDIGFPVGLDRKKFTLKQDSTLSLIYNKILDNNLNVTKPDKKLTFISVKSITEDEIFSKFFTEQLVKVATDFYVETKTKRYKVNVDKLQTEANDIEAALDRKTYAVAVSQDMNLNPARNQASVKTELATRDKIVLQTMYAEVVKNLELSKITMAQETPVIQIVDTPLRPLEKKKFGKLKGLVLGGFLGGFFTALWLVLRRVYKKIMG